MEHRPGQAESRFRAPRYEKTTVSQQGMTAAEQVDSFRLSEEADFAVGENGIILSTLNCSLIGRDGFMILNTPVWSTFSLIRRLVVRITREPQDVGPGVGLGGRYRPAQKRSMDRHIARVVFTGWRDPLSGPSHLPSPSGLMPHVRNDS